MTVTIDDLFRPFRGFDVAHLYSHYGPFVDFALFAVFFISLAYVTIGRRFQHRGLAISMGLILAVALAAAEPVIGFSIKSLGPLAAAVFLIFVGVFLFGIFHHLGMKSLLAASVSFIMIYFGLLLYSPNFIEWINRQFPFGGVLLLVALIITIYHVAVALWGDRKFPALPALPSWESVGRKSLSDEKRIERGALRRRTRKAQKASQRIIRELDDVIKILRRKGLTRATGPKLAAQLQDIAPARHDVAVQLAKLNQLTQQIESLDEGVLGQLKALPPDQRKQARDTIHDELRKLHATHRLKRFEQATATYQSYFDRYLSDAIQRMNAGDVEGAIKGLDYCRKAEEKAVRFLHRMKTFERRLLRLTTRELK